MEFKRQVQPFFVTRRSFGVFCLEWKIQINLHLGVLYGIADMGTSRERRLRHIFPMPRHDGRPAAWLIDRPRGARTSKSFHQTLRISCLGRDRLRKRHSYSLARHPLKVIKIALGEEQETAFNCALDCGDLG